MNKTAIHNFAVTARRKLRADIEYRCGLLGITDKGIAEPSVKEIGMVSFAVAGGVLNTLYGKDVENRDKIAQLVKQKGFGQFVEETAYTWFNRLIAIRFMEVNDYLPTRTRVLSSETPGKTEPDIVTEALQVDLGFNAKQLDYIAACKRDNNADELYRFLFLRQCNRLDEILPELFERMDDYSELLFGLSYIDPNGVLRELLDIPEEDFDVNRGGQVEIIGWLYQYYNEECKDETFALLKKNVKITKERIPSATQLFTPDWIVRYMVENSLGRLWIEGHPNGELRTGWKYYLDEAEQGPKVQKELSDIRRGYSALNPEDIKFIDPCMGSGHILVYAFDVLMEIYKSVGYTERDAAHLIVEKNLYGIDIDDRAYQLAYFAVMMKARQYDRRFLTRKVAPNLCAIQESNSLNPDYLKLFGDLEPTAKRLVTLFHDAKEYGSILNVDLKATELQSLRERLKAILTKEFDNIFDSIRQMGLSDLFVPLLKQAIILQRKYDVVVTNPPYMNGKGMNNDISSFIKKKYSDSSADIYAAFIEKSYELAKSCGYIGFMTSYTWLFLSSFSDMRKTLVSKKDIITLIQPEYHAMFEEAYVPICTFILRNVSTNSSGVFIKLSEFYGSDIQATKALEAINNPDCGYLYRKNTRDFLKIPGYTIAYWISNTVQDYFETAPKLSDIADVKKGTATGDDSRFLRLWFEVSISRFSVFNNWRAEKWVPFNKGGEYRKWYGNNEYAINWENNGYAIRNFKDDKGKLRSRPQNLSYFFRSGMTWTYITVSNLSFRYYPENFAFSAAAPAVFTNNKGEMPYLLALLNSKVAQVFADIVGGESLTYETGEISKIPIKLNTQYSDAISRTVYECISISRTDWDSFETSWDFTCHPLIGGKSVSAAFAVWEKQCEDRFQTLKRNEGELNRIFIGIYGLQDELTPEVEDKDVTVRRADLGRDIRSFISYAVGCMFGRYSLDVEGLAYAGGEWDEEKYKTFLPDTDNILPVSDDEYIADDIVVRFISFVKTVYGADTLEENLQFIADALGGRGTSQEVIRSYFLSGFYKDHLKVYQKRPIYWLFDSGKENGFKALIYMHRYDRDTVARVRTDYLHRIQAAFESAITTCDNTIAGSAPAAYKARAVKRKDKLVRQLAETRLYDQAIAHVAAQRIEIDLDDGVKHNYELFQGVEVASAGKKAQMIDLLAPIK